MQPSGDQVSIIIPCYNQGRYLVQSVRSALAQSHPNLEIIIVNDGSTDETGRVAREFSAAHPGRIKLIEQENQGQARARQAGLQAATGQFLIMLDADDLLEAPMAELCLRRMAGRDAPDLVAGDAWLIGEEGPRLRPIRQRLTPPWPRILENNPFGTLAAVMTRLDAVRRVGGLAVEGLPGVEDWDLWARMARCGLRFSPLGECVACYRQTPASTSHRAERMLRATLEMLERCRRPDPRLASFSPAAAVRPPIPEAAYQKFRNGKVFKALGLELAGGRGLPAGGRGLPAGGSSLAEAGAILAHLAPGRLSVRYCSDQFLEGMHFGFFLTRDPGALGGLNQDGLFDELEARLRSLGLFAAFPALRRELGRSLENPLRKRSLLARLRERIGR